MIEYLLRDLTGDQASYALVAVFLAGVVALTIKGLESG